MKHRRLVRSSLLCLMALAACTLSETATPTPEVASSEQRAPGMAVREKVVKVSATVDALDMETRMVTLRTSDGRRVSLRVDDSAVDLSQVKEGDVVAARYYESVEVRLRRPSEAAPGASVSEGAARTEAGEKPGMAGLRSVTIVATVRAVDREKQTATLESSDGRLQTVEVADPRNFDIAGVGDLVEIVHTEGVAISVEKPASK